MLHKSIDGRPVMEIKTERCNNDNIMVYGCTIGTHARHSHNMEYAKITKKEFTTLELISAYIRYFDLPIAVQKLAKLGIINL